MRAPEASAEKTGLLLLNKSPGLTSFESLYLVKKALATPKVGHTGTLDKFASGLLLVLVGRALKLCPWFSGCDKRYEAVIRFGVETDTLDPEGSPVARGEAPSPAALEAAMALFRGELLQTPPAYSAVHVGGERAYKLARSGRAVEMRQRPVTIYGLELSSYDPPLASIRVHCSAGTYIRSLARDIALAAGSRGHLSALNRTQVAGFKLEDAVEPMYLSKGPLNSWLRPIDKTVISSLGLPWFEIDPHCSEKIIHGKPLSQIIKDVKSAFSEQQKIPPDITVALFVEDSFIAMIERNNGGWKYGYVYGAGML